MYEIRQNDSHHREIPLESTMQRVSLILSVLALPLMICGFAVLTWEQGLSFPGPSATSLGELLHPGNLLSGQGLLSLGILALAISPAIRVLLALVIYVRSRDWADALTALGVLAVLLLGAYTPKG